MFYSKLSSSRNRNGSRKFFKHFHTCHKLGFCGAACSCEDKLWLIKSGLHSFQKLTFPKLCFSGTTRSREYKLWAINQGCTTFSNSLSQNYVWQLFKFIGKYCRRELAVKHNFRKVNFLLMYNPDHIAHSLSSHVHAVPQNPGLHSVWNYFKNFSSFCNKL